MGRRQWGRLASGAGAVGAVVAGVAVNQVGDDSAWPWQVAMAVLAAIALWLTALLSHASAAKEPVAAEDVPATGAAGRGDGPARHWSAGYGPPGALPVPRQLPARPTSFAGRETDLATLDALLAESSETRAVVISAITGTGGVGKTTLALHWAHRVREHFPDGDLFVNLRGYDPGQPMTSQQALDGFLRALDVPAPKIPPDLDAQAALFRSLLDGRQLLIVLDNAANVEQVRPLLPAADGCLALITSRSRLSGLAAREGVSRVPIDVLSPEQAIALLRQVIGDARVGAEPDQAAELAHHCGYLPLALRIAADRAVTHPYLTLADLVGELVDERDRLDVLASNDDATTAVRAVFSWSYKRLAPNTARVFRLLGLNAGPDMSTEAAAALTGLARHQTERMLDMLVGQHLLEQTERNRYRFHDLLRVYAGERVTFEESKEERSIAVGRMLDWYLHTALAARRITHPNGYEPPLHPADPSYPRPTFSTNDDALEWWKVERSNLVAAIRQCADIGLDITVWKLTHVVIAFLILSWHVEEWHEVLRIGTGAAQRLGDQHAQALMLLDIGELFVDLGRFTKAAENFRKSLPLSRNSGTPWIEGFCLTGLGFSYKELNRLDEAAYHLHEALRIFREAGEKRGEGTALGHIGTVHQSLGEPAEAISYYEQAVSIFEQTANDLDRAWALRLMGAAHYDLGHLDEAVGLLHHALRICREKRDRRYAALILVDLGEVQLADGQGDDARRSWQEALAIFGELGDPMADEIRTRLAARFPPGMRWADPGR